MQAVFACFLTLLIWVSFQNLCDTCWSSTFSGKEIFGINCVTAKYFENASKYPSNITRVDWKQNKDHLGNVTFALVVTGHPRDLTYVH